LSQETTLEFEYLHKFKPKFEQIWVKSGIPMGSMNKIGGQKSRATVSLRQVSSDSKNIFG
jgi:hypothetical protein